MKLSENNCYKNKPKLKQKQNFYRACGLVSKTYLNHKETKYAIWFGKLKINLQFEMVYKDVPQHGTNIIQLIINHVSAG